MGFGIWGFWALGFRVWGFGAWGLGLRFWGLGLGFRSYSYQEPYLSDWQGFLLRAPAWNEALSRQADHCRWSCGSEGSILRDIPKHQTPRPKPATLNQNLAASSTLNPNPEYCSSWKATHPSPRPQTQCFPKPTPCKTREGFDLSHPLRWISGSACLTA